MVRVLLLLLALLPTLAFADGRDLKALYRSGTDHYNLAEYTAALDDFKAAYRQSHDPIFLFNVAQCYRQLHDYGSAATFYRSYRRGSTDSRSRAAVDRLIAQMDQAEAGERARQPPVGTEPPGVTESTETQPTGAALTASSKPAARPLVKRPWFWVGIGGAAVVVTAAVVLGVVLGQPRDPTATYGRVPGD